MPRSLLFLPLLLFTAAGLYAQDRDTKVRNDRQAVGQLDEWIYNVFGQAREEARRADKPLLAVLRCIP